MKKKEFIKAAYYQELELPLMETVEKYFPELVKKDKPHKNGDIVVFNAKWNNIAILVKITNVGKGSCYGFMRGEFGEFNNYSFKSHPSDWKKVDVSVWKERLIEECKKRGIWDTPNINPLSEHIISEEPYEQDVEYDSDYDMLWSNFGLVYKNGIFATPIETITKEEAEKQLGKKIV